MKFVGGPAWIAGVQHKPGGIAPSIAARAVVLARVKQASFWSGFDSSAADAREWDRETNRRRNHRRTRGFWMR